MIKYFEKHKSAKIFLLIIFLLLFFGVMKIIPANAASIRKVQDVMSRLKTSEKANHDIRFQVNAEYTGDIMVDLISIISSTGAVDATDIDLRYGSSENSVYGIGGALCNETALCRNYTVSGTSGGAGGTWGAAWGTGGTAERITLFYPSSGGTPIAANDYVRILIGTNAAGGVEQMINEITPQANLLGAITLGTDSGSFAIALLSNEQITVSAKISETMSFSFTPNTTVTIAGNDCGASSGVTSGPNALDFGTLSSGTARWGCYDFSVATNAANGFSVSLAQNANLTNAGGADIDKFKDGVTTASAIWAPPTAISGTDDTYGHMGISSSDVSDTPPIDPAAEGGAYSGNRFLGLLDTPLTREIAVKKIPTTSVTTGVIFKIEISTLQEAGSYSNVVTAIASGQF